MLNLKKFFENKKLLLLQVMDFFHPKAFMIM